MVRVYKNKSIFDKNDKNFRALHNISYNYWIRGFAASKVKLEINYKLLFYLLRTLQL